MYLLNSGMKQFLNHGRPQGRARGGFCPHQPSHLGRQKNMFYNFFERKQYVLGIFQANSVCFCPLPPERFCPPWKKFCGRLCLQAHHCTSAQANCLKNIARLKRVRRHLNITILLCYQLSSVIIFRIPFSGLIFSQSMFLQSKFSANPENILRPRLIFLENRFVSERCHISHRKKPRWNKLHSSNGIRLRMEIRLWENKNKKNLKN